MRLGLGSNEEYVSATADVDALYGREINIPAAELQNGVADSYFLQGRSRR
jgi:hypothetical protein